LSTAYQSRKPDSSYRCEVSGEHGLTLFRAAASEAVRDAVEGGAALGTSMRVPVAPMA
jgi:hypothetical protein